MGEGAPGGGRLYHGGSKHRHKIFRHIAEVNVILQKYMPETFEDYQRMDEADLKALIGLFRAMRPGSNPASS